jgi:glycerol-3-phosphate dehydrogenase
MVARSRCRSTTDVVIRVGIVGGGINGLCCAWRLAKHGYQVTLFERGLLMGATSRASSKLLHGGLRYLENGELRLVREALRERDAWLRRVPAHTHPVRLVMPLYRDGRRSATAVAVGLALYRLLAGSDSLPGARWRSAKDLCVADPKLKPAGLRGGFEFSDGQMDDFALGLWVAEQARACGAELREGTGVVGVTQDGHIRLRDGGVESFDRIVNVAGPWAERLLEQSGLSSSVHLDLVRGSHIEIEAACPQAYLLEVPGERRIFFVLPWKGRTLVGTTEVRQSLDDPVECSPQEEAYLLSAYRHYFPDVSAIVCGRFAGLRPLLRSAEDPTRATREYALQRTERLITVFGGKWTTAVALAAKVEEMLA